MYLEYLPHKNILTKEGRKLKKEYKKRRKQYYIKLFVLLYSSRRLLMSISEKMWCCTGIKIENFRLYIFLFLFFIFFSMIICM